MPNDFLNASSPLPRIAMVSTHGYVAANPPLGAADTGGQVVFVLELSKKLAQLGYEVDIWTRQFEDQPEWEPVAEQVRIIRIPCGEPGFIPKEFLNRKLPQWSENALRFIKKHGLKYVVCRQPLLECGLGGTAPERGARRAAHPHPALGGPLEKAADGKRLSRRLGEVRDAI